MDKRNLCIFQSPPLLVAAQWQHARTGVFGFVVPLHHVVCISVGMGFSHVPTVRLYFDLLVARVELDLKRSSPLSSVICGRAGPLNGAPLTLVVISVACWPVLGCCPEFCLPPTYPSPLHRGFPA